MTARQSSANRRTVSASAVLQSLADDLSTIKHEDRLTFADLGRVLGKSEDQAAKYCDGTAEMGVTAYAFARREWNGRFTGSLDRLICGARTDRDCDQTKQSKVLKAALALSVALEDGEVDEQEVRANRATIEAARDALEALLNKLTPRVVA